ERRLAAKVEQQRLREATGRFDRCGHLGKNVDVRAAKSIYRLFAIADDEKVRAPREGQFPQQVALQSVRILKLIDQKIPVTIGYARQHGGLIEQHQRAQLQIVEIQNRESLFLGIETRRHAAQQTEERDRILAGK